jgi:hypothetical protein
MKALDDEEDSPQLAHGGGSGDGTDESADDSGDSGDEGDDLGERAAKIVIETFRTLNARLVALSNELMLEGEVLIDSHGSIVTKAFQITYDCDDHSSDSDSEEEVESLIEDLAEHLEETETSVGEAAEAMGLSAPTVYAWLSGRTGSPSAKSLAALRDYLEDAC